MTGLTWEEKPHSHIAWSGDLVIGAITPVAGGKWWFDATFSVRMMHLGGTVTPAGSTDTLDQAKAAVELAWATWLQLAGLKK